ncbi:hypothetical protein DM01DRAFT_1117296, partial [Hesseltinella vesiculosa]
KKGERRAPSTPQGHNSNRLRKTHLLFTQTPATWTSLCFFYFFLLLFLFTFFCGCNPFLKNERSSIETYVMTDINALSQYWKAVRGSDDEAEQVQTLKTLYDTLGQQGTPATSLISQLGKPDEITHNLGQSIIPTMPGPVLTESLTDEPPSMYFVYYANKDKSSYAAFKVDSDTETVQTAEWH